MGAPLLRIGLYFIVSLLPLIGVALFHLPTHNPFTYDIGRSFALLGFSFLFLQIVMAARLCWVEKPFGLNRVFPFHRYLGVYVTALLLAHPLLLAIGGGGWPLLIGRNVHWYIWIGRIVLLLLLGNLVLSLWRIPFAITFENWRFIHDLLVPSIFSLAFLHSWFAGGDLTVLPMQFLWQGLLATGIFLYGGHRLLTPWWLRRHPYRIADIRQETHDVWTLKFIPPEGRKRFDFLPGQFQFVTLFRRGGLPTEEHHFTISSSPTESDFHTATIKESGDFTATIGQTQPGERAAIQAPFGRFSYLLHPEERNLLLIAGGIGITPLISNLRYMRDTRDDKKVLLLYSNRRERDIIFHDELSRIEGGEKPEFKAIYILSQPGETWEGEKGRIDREKIERYGHAYLKSGHFYVCGPPPLVQGVRQILRNLRVKNSRIFLESFSL